MDKILVSACLLGEKCTYKGGDNAQNYLKDLNEFYDLVPFCCEVEGGLTIPRLPSEIKGNGVINSEGKDVSSAFRLGVYKASSVVSYLDIRLAILKEDSPSCGVHRIHDGYFSGRLIKGQGMLTRELTRLGVTVMNEEEGLAFLENLKKQKQIKDEKTRIAIAKENKPKTEEEPSDFKREKSYGDRKGTYSKKPYGKKTYGDRKDGKSFEKKPYGKKSFGNKDGKPFEKKPYGKKDGKKPFAKGQKKTDYGFRKPSTFKPTRGKPVKKD